MIDRIERTLSLPAPPETVWEVVTDDGWLAEEVRLELRPGGDAYFRSRESSKAGWVEEATAPSRLSFWWAVDDEPATRVELTLDPLRDGGTQLTLVESRPLDVLELIGTPLGRLGGASFGPALVAA
jgi:uncharacterized protein YndB with AHSA1/START domain